MMTEVEELGVLSCQAIFGIIGTVYARDKDLYERIKKELNAHMEDWENNETIIRLNKTSKNHPKDPLFMHCSELGDEP